MNKLDMESKNIVSSNISNIAALFPECVIENHIDFDKLKQLLSYDLLDNTKEKYQLTWPGKKDAMVLCNRQIDMTLVPIKNKSSEFDNTGNLYVEGDNLDVLKILQESYLNRIRCIYIDPPYNTGNDFIYNDNFNKSLNEELLDSNILDEEGKRLVSNSSSNGKFHSDWLSMMYPRLKLARNLLTDQGVLFVSIGEEELSTLKLILDELFGEKNYISTISRVAKNASNMGNYFAASMDYILCYARNVDQLPKFKGEVDESLFKKVEIDGPFKGEKYRDDIAFFQSGLKHGGSRYAIECPDGQLVNTPDNKPWRANEKTFTERKKSGKIIFKETNTSPLIDENTGEKAHWNIYTKSYLFERKEIGTQPRNIFDGFINRKGADLLKSYSLPFDFAKPVELIEYLLKIIDDSNALVLDFFSGSATTAEAIMRLNAIDNGNRKYALI